VANYHIVHAEGASAADLMRFPGIRFAASGAVAQDACTVSWPWDVSALTHLTTLQAMGAVRASLTHEGRRYLARSPVDGLYLTVTRFVLGTGRTYDPSWYQVPQSSPDSTTLVMAVFMGSVATGDMIVEEANASSLSLRCRGPAKPLSPPPNELIIYARINHSPTATDLGREIPFACVRLQPWFAAPAASPAQRFVARVVIPLGSGTRVVGGSTMFLHRLHADVVHVNDALAVVETYVGPPGVWTQQQKIAASDAAAQDYFGYCVSVNKTTAVIGAYNNMAAAGTAYASKAVAGVWAEQHLFTASDPAANNWFGYSTGVDGDTAVVGAPTSGGVPRPGRAYIYTRTAGVWTEQQRIVPSDSVNVDYWARDVAISGNSVLIGGQAKDGAVVQSGAAYVFTRTAGVWTEQQKFWASDGLLNNNFGAAVDIDGDSCLIGSHSDGAQGASAGSAYVFTRTAGVWTQQQKLLASDGVAGQWLGSSVALHGDTAVVGAWGYNAEQGAVYVWTRTAGVWTQLQKLTASDGVAGDRFGYSVAIDGNWLVVGAYVDDTSAGSIYLFYRSAGVWTEYQKLIALDAAVDDRFGWSVSISGRQVVVGAPRDDDHGANSGSVYIFYEVR